MMKLLLISLTALCLANCARPWNVKVSKVHILPEIPKGETFNMKVKPQANSLQQPLIDKKLINGFQKYGWRFSAGAGADYNVLIEYGRSDGYLVHGVRAISGQTGGGTTYHSGTVYNGGSSASFSGTSYQPATYGVIGAVPITEVNYTRHMYVTIKDKANKLVYEGKFISAGQTDNIYQALPVLIDSMFYDFPGWSGFTEDYDMPHGVW